MSQKQAAQVQSTAADTAFNILEGLILAFILAFVFRAFVMEAFRIPTGSMADTLKGAHFRLRCPQCGFRYDYGFLPFVYHLPEEAIPGGEIPVRPESPRCSSCGYFLSQLTKMPVSSGDRILVLKTIFQFVEPNRWDVVVFKTPFAPRINYIKRLLGRPGETLQIIDGDVYINGKIARKPPKIQEELWMPVYNNDYQPVQPEEGNFNGHAWRQPFENTSGSTWKLATSSDPTCFSLESAKDQVNTLIYNSAVGNDFRAAYSYNQPASYQFLPNVSDLRLSFYADLTEDAGMIGIALSKYQVTYKASIEPNGLMLITSAQDGKPETVLARKKIEKLPTGPFVPVNFANVDHMLVFNVGENQLVRDMGRDSNSIGNPDDIEPSARLMASGKVTLSHISLDRDIYYTGDSVGPGGRRAKLPRGTEPVTLGKDDYFMLGDNSPSSSDSRYWESYGIGNNGKHYRPGIVPRDYMLGKAMFVYWPAGFKPFHGAKLAIVPNFGALRFIHGGLETYNY